MPRAILLAFTNPVEGASEDEYNAWYDGRHVPDVLQVAGVRSARRLQLSPTQLRAPAGPPARYLAVYEIEADSLEDVLAEWSARGAAGQMPISPTVDREGSRAPLILVYEER
ncbi:MAG TPA: hypothetical protein VKB25_00800 [Conexibacter sp.]|nr:hypothetical protein [Conexibacter sp.]